MPSLNVDLQSLAVANLHADEEHRGFTALHQSPSFR
jgi:hypothetical protein